MKKEACGTFGRPVEALRNNPADFLKRSKSSFGASQKKAADAKEGARFVYPGKRCVYAQRIQQNHAKCAPCS